MRFEARLSGSGGQGLLLAGIILAEAAILDGMNAVQTQSYGPEARGGASRSEVIIADEPIDYPKVTDPDLVLALSREAFRKFVPASREDATVIVDKLAVDEEIARGRRLIELDIIGAAREATGRAVTANVVAVGVLAGVCRVVDPEKVQEAVLMHVPPQTRELNVKAFRAGLDLARGI